MSTSRGESGDDLIRSILELAPNGIYEIDANGTILFSNPAHHRMLGYEPGTLVGRNIVDLVPEAEAVRLRHDLAMVCRERPKPQPYLKRCFTRDGSEIVVEVHWTYKMADDGAIIGFVAILNDVTARLEAEALQEQARRAAEVAAISQSRLLAAASHDLRQPMQALSLFVSRLERRGMDDVAREIVCDIRESVNTLSSLLNALLDISKLDAGMTRATMEDVPLDELFRSIARDFGPVAERKGLRLRVRPPANGAVVRSDGRMLRRIIGNLVMNAITYTNDGGVLVTGRRRGAAARIEVWDTGIGIDDKQLSRVFREFYRVANPSDACNEGLGLGLAIVDRAARALGHVVDVRSRLGHGSVFAITVPLARAATVPVAVPSCAEGEEQTQDQVSLPPLDAAVAVVEGDPAVRRGLAALLEEWGCRLTVVAGDGTGLLRAVVENDARPDVILTDLRLPGRLDGLATVAAARESLGASVPALIVTGDTDPLRLQDVTRAGLPLLHKPVPDAELHATLSRLLNQVRVG